MNDALHKSSELKLNLLYFGVRLSDEVYAGLGSTAKEMQYGYNDSNQIGERNIIPSELILPGGIVVACHLRRSSPYIIKKIGKKLFVLNEPDDKVISEVSYLPRPKFWNLHLSSGESVKQYLNIYGKDCLNLFISADCEFWNKGMPCAFCSLKPSQNKHHEVISHKEENLNKLKEAVSLAFSAGDELNWMIVTGGSMCNRKAETDKYVAVLETIQSSLPESWKKVIKGNVALLPDNSVDDLMRLYAAGVEHPSYNLEVWGKENYSKLCPGKNIYVGFNETLKAYVNSVSIWGVGNVWCNFVGGLIPLDQLKDGFRFMADLGVVPGANIFHVDPGTVAERDGLNGPDMNFILDMYYSLGEIYHEYGYKPFFNEGVLRNSLANEVYNGWL